VLFFQQGHLEGVKEGELSGSDRVEGSDDGELIGVAVDGQGHWVAFHHHSLTLAGESTQFVQDGLLDVGLLATGSWLVRSAVTFRRLDQ